MSGMVTTGETANTSSYGTHTLELKVTGICRQDVMLTSNYTVKVPYSRMASTLKNINRMGGKVTKVTVLSNTTPTESTTTEDE